MRIINHNAVLATTPYDKCITSITDWISKLDAHEKQLFIISPAQINGYITVIMIPDGSKEMRPESANGDNLRQRFIDRLLTYNYSDGSSPWEFIEVGYGDYGQKVLRGNNVNVCNNKKYAIKSHIGKKGE